MRLAKCKGCGAIIFWIGKMPCDTEQIKYRATPGARDRLITPEGKAISVTLAAGADKADGIGYRPHWATCPAADSFRRKGTRERHAEDHA